MYCVIKLLTQGARIDHACSDHCSQSEHEERSKQREYRKRREACYDKGYGMRELHKIAIPGYTLEFSRYITIKWSMILTINYWINNNAEMVGILILSRTFTVRRNNQGGTEIQMPRNIYFQVICINIIRFSLIKDQVQ